MTVTICVLLAALARFIDQGLKRACDGSHDVSVSITVPRVAHNDSRAPGQYDEPPLSFRRAD
jgi:hypothetical protein